jgi:hypothetical protein
LIGGLALQLEARSPLPRQLTPDGGERRGDVVGDQARSEQRRGASVHPGHAGGGGEGLHALREQARGRARRVSERPAGRDRILREASGGKLPKTPYERTMASRPKAVQRIPAKPASCADSLAGSRAWRHFE